MNVHERGDLGAESRRWVELACLVPAGTPVRARIALASWPVSRTVDP
jgi:hypothetical protein